MRPISVSEDIVPLGEFKAQASRFLKVLGEGGQTLIVTQHGRPAAVVMSPAEFDRLREHQRFLESITAGLADAEAGRVVTTEELLQNLHLSPAEDEPLA